MREPSAAGPAPLHGAWGVLWRKLRDPVLTLGFQDLLETHVGSAATIRSS